MARKRSKKAISWGLTMVASLILALLFTTAGIQMIRRISKEVNYGFDKGLCKESVIWNSKYRVKYIEAEQFELKCPTRYVTIDVDNIKYEKAEGEPQERTIRGVTSLDDDSSKERFLDTVNPAIADLIFDCWDQFAAGQLAIFSRYEAQRQCLICSRIEFTEKVQVAFGEDWYSGLDEETSLEEYMATHSPGTVMVGGLENHTISYVEFTLDPVDAFVRQPYEYRVSEPMAVVFTAINEYHVKVLLGDLWEGIKKYLLRDSRQPKEAPRFVNKLDFVPYSEVKYECEVLR
jgi:hypothetical protein